MEISDTVTKLLNQQQQKIEKEGILKEKREDFKIALNNVFNNDDGLFVLNCIAEYCDLLGFDKTGNPARMLEDNTRKKLFHEVFLAYLEKDIKQRLEIIK